LASADFGQAAEAEPGKAPGATQNVFLFFRRKQGELSTPGYALLIGGQKGVHQRRNKAKLAMTIADHGDADQAALAPTVDRLRRHVELLADLVNRQHRLRDLRDRDRRQRIRQLVDPQAEVVDDVRSGDQESGIGIRAIIGYPETDELVGIRAARVNFSQQLFGTLKLFEPARRRRETNLLVRQLLQCLVLIGCHGMHSVSNHRYSSLTMPRCSLFDPANNTFKRCLKLQDNGCRYSLILRRS
jgi:hypothetical protein